MAHQQQSIIQPKYYFIHENASELNEKYIINTKEDN